MLRGQSLEGLRDQGRGNEGDDAQAQVPDLAGKERHLSQPAISKIIREVEDIFGTRLFDRSRNGMHPNRVGEALIMRAEALLNQL
ncbi:MAG: LysR family transcriptional regulator, partial [Comamonadaceae bacterium]